MAALQATSGFTALSGDGTFAIHMTCLFVSEDFDVVLAAFAHRVGHQGIDFCRLIWTSCSADVSLRRAVFVKSHSEAESKPIMLAQDQSATRPEIPLAPIMRRVAATIQ